MIKKIVIANRGEIAVRIIRACRELEIEPVVVYSQADREALHVQLAEQAYCIGPARSADSYLNVNAILTVAQAAGCDAIHPGYGFLSENADFADACEAAGITFIGPSGDVIRAMGNKAAARKLMQSAGVPVVPGSDGAMETAEDAKALADSIGYPVLIKASAGGGGRGMRRVYEPEQLIPLFEEARSESVACFGSGEMYLEKLILDPRHIEFQILADSQGNVIHLGERDCSIQRRRQKLIEESPSPAVSRSQRKKLMELTARAVKAIGYVGVGTLEFLLDRDGRFWFMEMNLRLQVEHGVTEMLTQVDLVKWQIRTAAGVPLNFQQQNVALNGACVECRINALTPGTLSMLHVPGGPFVRFDTYLVSGISVSPYYDALLGKLIVYAGTREEAMRKMKAALCELVVEGIETNIAEQLELVSDPRFMTGQYDLTFMEGR